MEIGRGGREIGKQYIFWKNCFQVLLVIKTAIFYFKLLNKSGGKDPATLMSGLIKTAYF